MLKKNIGYIILIIFLISILPILLWLVAFSIETSSKDNAEKRLKKDNEDIVLITNYLADSDYVHLSISNTDNIEKNTKITNEEVKNAISRLLKKKDYYMISKDGNTIRFTIWTKLMDFGSGIVYSINEVDKPVIQYLTKLESLSEDGWYYYEADYNEWRLYN